MKNTGLDWEKILKKIMSYASCPQSASALEDIEPYVQPSIALNNMALISDFQELLEDPKVSRVRLDSFENVDSWIYSIKKGQTLKIIDLVNVRNFMTDLSILKNSYPWQNYENLISLCDRIFSPETYLEYINQTISDEGQIRSDASPLLLESFNEKKSLSNKIHKILDGLVKDFSLEDVLQDRYVTTREGRWVLPVISGKQHDFQGIIHDSSHSKQTVFMEPQEVIGLNNKIRQLDETIEREIERLLKEISLFLFEQSSEIQKGYELVVEIDKLSSIALWANDYQAKTPKVSTSTRFQLRQVFHPLLLDETPEPIKNNLELDPKEKILILSGPNAGGKTVFLKSVGLACHMVRCGLPICAHPESEIPFFHRIEVIIGDLQSVEKSMSTFAAHLNRINEGSKLRGARNLILVDEICGSTEAGEGSALARAFIEVFSKNGINGFITSHLGPLKVGWDKNDGVVNGSMYFDQSKGTPTFEFVKGVPGESLALETARKVGVPEEIIDRALHFLTPEQRKKYSGLVEIETLQESLKKERQAYENKLRELDEIRKEYKDLINDFKSQQDDLLEFSLSRAKENMEQMSNYSKVKKLFSNRKHLNRMQDASPKIIKSNSNQGSVTDSAESFNKKFPPGTQVYIPSLKRNGIVQGEVTSKGFVPVLSDSMRLQIKWDELRKPGHQETENKKIKPPVKRVLEEKIENQVDVRGKNVEEALEELEEAIDRSLRIGSERLKIIHGHGTETLKRNVRTFLSRHPSVKSWKTGVFAGESDGVTFSLF